MYAWLEAHNVMEDREVRGNAFCCDSTLRVYLVYLFYFWESGKGVIWLEMMYQDSASVFSPQKRFG